MDRSRQLRTRAMYVDVLDIPSISEAVQEASRMLRRGIVQAMSSHVEPPRQHPTIVTNATTSQTTTAASRDPLSVYSAVTKRPRKPSSPPTPAESLTASRDPLSVYSAVTKTTRKPAENPLAKESSPADLPKPPGILKQHQPALRNWDREKKAGPSILSKRSRPESSDAPTMSVFQPAPKRERREKLAASSNSTQVAQTTTPTQTPTADATAAATPTSADTSSATATKAAAASITSDLGQVRIETAQLTLLKPTQPDPEKETVTRSPQLAKPTKTDASKVAVENKTNSKQPSATEATKVIAIQAAKAAIANGAPKVTNGRNALANAGAVKRGGINPPRVIPVSTPKAGIPKKQTAQPIVDRSGRIETLEGAAAAMASASRQASRRALPSAWGQVSTLSSLRKKVGGGVAPIKTPALRNVRPEGSSPRLSADQQKELARRGGLALNLHTVRNGSVSSAGSDAIPPSPSAGGSNMQYVPGSGTIDGVRPNGYVVNNKGVVKPMVAFSSRPKVPHKLRQTSLEKMFSAWTGERKVSDAEALEQCLKTEQELYAGSANRIEYRGSVVTKLKEIRNGTDKAVAR